MVSNPASVASLGKSSVSGSKSETVSYLLLYEAMVRHQDLEFDATHDHIKLTVDRIKYLGRPKAATAAREPALVDEAPAGMLTYLEMRRCLLRLGYTWNRSLPSASSSQSGIYYDDDVSVASVNSSSTFLSGQNASSASNMSAATRDIIATDAQLIMLLTTLVEIEEKCRAAKLKNDEDDYDPKTKGLFLPEFIQAYKLIIGGMQSLQTYPNPDVDKPDVVKQECANLHINPELLSFLRQRSRDRTLGLLRLFGPEELKTAEGNTSSSSSTHSGQGNFQSAGESPTSNRNPKDAFTPNRSNKRSPSANMNPRSMLPKDGLQPRLSDAEIRKLVHSKDTALAKILEEHESEMNVMATNMEELRIKEARIQVALKKRRKRTRLAIALGVALTVCGGVAMEYYRREQVTREITLGREAERAADAATIRQLKEEVISLSQKVQDAEATIRYEEGRYESIKASSAKTAKELEAMQVKWLMDQGELEQCRVQRKELDLDLIKLNARHEEISEEVGWCRERLESTERAMEGMERALKAKNDMLALGGQAPTLKEIAKSIDADEDAAEKKKEQDGKSKLNSKPVQMEMKYNKSFRNAVILRQIYSAAGGLLASVVVQGLLPGLGRVFSFLFLG
ncbi:hypothetical protein HJC23_013845 [Cyclotella cryptica]|uniref:Uncharacterized protein n=1 Tax=Cyclotella cryptica TaxID=29204 RepID=A0ABD3P9K2_9STRA|eukprot:CCRYP_016330-RA/>CCRYP_016330-RA protein AED:0.00 eAED:0.00 QI:302/-1/1/1/-1/1/1/569/624